MKKQMKFLLLSVPVLVVMLSSCRKEVDQAFTPTEVVGTPLPGQNPYCRIESLWDHPGASDQRFVLFLYDEYENPTMITQPVVTTGHPLHVFKYDSWHRLREYRGDYYNGNKEFWHLYGYDQNGRIGVDTTYIFVVMANGSIQSYSEKRISTITYDGQGRISKVITASNQRPDLVEQTYTYDASGNLVYPSGFGITYDNKMNIFRTNDIWQFLNRDYSMNNPIPATSYNAAGFPTVTNGNRGGFLNDYHIDKAQIGYKCR